MTTLDPESLFQAVAAVIFLAAGIDLGIAFLTRSVQESTND